MVVTGLELLKTHYGFLLHSSHTVAKEEEKEVENRGAGHGGCDSHELGGGAR